MLKALRQLSHRSSVNLSNNNKRIIRDIKPLLTVAPRSCVHEGSQQLCRESCHGGQGTIAQQWHCCWPQQQHATHAVDQFPAQQHRADCAVHRQSADAPPESGSTAPEQHTHTCLTTLCPGLPRWVSARKVKAIWILLKQETVSGNGISWATCNSAPHSRQIIMPAPHHSVFYRLDALPAAQPTASKHWRQITAPEQGNNKRGSWSFHHLASMMWNSLILHLFITNLHSFKKHKTF